MSDYLWDKAGDGDAEVERLEGLLGALRYRPQEFELPPQIEAVEPRQHVRRFYGRASYRAAAALLLMLFLGLWFGVLRQRRDAAETEHLASRPQPQSSPLNVSPQREASPNENAQGEASPPQRPDQFASTDARAFEPPRRNKRDDNRRVFAGRAAPVMPHEREGVARVETPVNGTKLNAVAYTAAEQQEAKSQLMYALRLTSVKLGEIQRKSRAVDDEKSVPLQRNIIR